MKILLYHVVGSRGPQISNAGNPEPSCRIARSPIHVSFLTSPVHVPTRQPPTTCRVKSHIELVVSDSEHTLAPFHNIIYNKTYIIRIVSSSRT